MGNTEKIYMVFLNLNERNVIATRGVSKASKSFTAQIGLFISLLKDNKNKLFLSIILGKQKIINGFKKLAPYY